ncbi:protein of unknown function [Paraburkholderia dioscoreae]|uniref:Uncharacterized protein n=1 Tax=Paraburkholderia dioscoreae TaxID=2604047 RepID=A0A5Q4ZVS5_9BURK|nr:protein of unknown function [Paraburkholderia dioscoreae]
MQCVRLRRPSSYKAAIPGSRFPMLDHAKTARPKSGRQAVYSIRHALAALHDLLFRHRFTGNCVVAIDANGDPAATMIDTEKDVLAGAEAGEFEHRVSDLHPWKGDSLTVVMQCVRWCCLLENNRNSRALFGTGSAWFKIGVSHEQLLG